MTDTRFLPFETTLDRESALGILRAATDGADDGELFLERRRAEALAFDDGRLKTASYDASEGFGLRAVRGEVAGYAHSTEISEAALTRAAETARLAVGDGAARGPTPRRQQTHGFTQMQIRFRVRSSRSRSKRCAQSMISRAASTSVWFRCRPPLRPACRKSKSCGRTG